MKTYDISILQGFENLEGLGSRRQQPANLFQSSETLEKLTKIPKQKQIKQKH
jgi:hypothetical protein